MKGGKEDVLVGFVVRVGGLLQRILQICWLRNTCDRAGNVPSIKVRQWGERLFVNWVACIVIIHPWSRPLNKQHTHMCANYFASQAQFHNGIKFKK